MSGLRFDVTALAKGLESFDSKISKATELYAKTAGDKMVNSAKSDAKWIDRTGNSRQTIDKNIIPMANGIEIQIRGNTPHFKYLELAHEKRWAVLWPTIQKHSSDVIKGWAKFIWK